MNPVNNKNKNEDLLVDNKMFLVDIKLWRNENRVGNKYFQIDNNSRLKSRIIFYFSGWMKIFWIDNKQNGR